MICVIDAAAVVDVLIRSDTGERVRHLLASDPEAMLLSVALLDAEVLSALARLQRAGTLSTEDVDTGLDRLAALPAERLPITVELLHAAWQLRENIAARDALYVAAAAALDAKLLTTDARLARAVPDRSVAIG